MKTDTIEKVKNVARDYQNKEKGNASRILAKQGVYIDIAGIEWTKKQLEKLGEEKVMSMFGFNPLPDNKE